MSNHSSRIPPPPSRPAWRKTTQNLLPALHPGVAADVYDLYPSFPVAAGSIALGYDALAERLIGQGTVVIDGYIGVFWDILCQGLDQALQRRGIEAEWLNVRGALRPEPVIERMVEPFLGDDDPLFGTRYPGGLSDFFDPEKLQALQADTSVPLRILYGCGAALAGWEGLLIYVDLPKNEIQFRARAGSICNLGMDQPDDPKQMYKRFYFVDWVVLNRHKATLLPRIDYIVDEQRPQEPAWMPGDELRRGLQRMSHNVFRVRPWFEPGAWGGQWLKRHIPQLPHDAPNYAWSFELIAPENGLIFSADQRLIEVSFDFLMYQDAQAVLGDSAERFGYEFPIRFDYLDTFDGGNLSVQCHPQPEYIKLKFGETFTQGETYYILDCKPGAEVYLGFQEDVDPAAFRAALETSRDQATPVDVERFVQTHAVHKHDLFLIPYGTIHCSGANTLVLEISATPYIFTFKMYDWMRLDLDGKPRPLNIERAFENLVFERKGEQVRRELLSQPTLIAEGSDWRLVHLPTHPAHFYDVHRFEFETEVQASTDGSCHVLNLVEGRSVILETAQGMRQRFAYAETFVVPAAAGSYRLINDGPERAKVVKAFVKPRSEQVG